MSILDKDSMTEDHWSNNPRFRKTSMTEEDEEFNRIEREAAMRMEAVAATVAKREWLDLTDEEIDGMVQVTDLSGAYYYDDLYAVVRAAEKLLKEKNT
jgi:hypothetical protein